MLVRIHPEKSLEILAEIKSLYRRIAELQNNIEFTEVIKLTEVNYKARNNDYIAKGLSLNTKKITYFKQAQIISKSK